MTRIIAMAAILTIALSAVASAGLNADGRVTVHVIPHGSRSCTKNFPSITGCEDIVTTEAGSDVDAFPVFFDLVEYQGLEYSMTWPGMYSTVFTTCSDLTIGGITNPGDAVSHSWYDCQNSTVAIPGFAWITDYGLISIVPHAGAGHINAGDCQGGTTADSILVGNSCPAGIGGTATGGDPCECAVEPCSWSGIKKMFR
jgi:hypothetical protein